MSWITLLPATALAAVVVFLWLRNISLSDIILGQRASAELESAARQAEADALRAKTNTLNQELNAVLEHCGAGLLLVSETGIVLRANEEGRDLLCVTGPDSVGRPLIEVTLSDEVMNLFREVTENRSCVTREIRLETAKPRTLVITMAPVGDAGYLLAAHNITTLRSLETVRRDFVANVSHELRTPLASIRAMAETLRDGALNDEDVSGRFLDTIIAEAQRLTRISEDLLVLSDAESRRPERTKFTINDLVDEVMSRSRPAAESARITLTAEVPHDLELNASYDQLQQVLLNLVDNGIKYTHAGGSVTVNVTATDQTATICVSDTGIGIMREHLPRIFERFYRVDKARSRKSGGTGLGLSIVRRIVEAHGGTVTVQSEFGRGSTFTVTLPRS